MAIFWLEDCLKYVANCGSNGCTTAEVAKRFGVSTVLARTRLDQLFKRDEVQLTNRKRKHPTSTNFMSVYVIASEATYEPHAIGPQEFANVQDYLAKLGHDEDFEPREPSFVSTSLPGSEGRISDYRRRVDRGEAIFCERDMRDGFVRHGEIPGLDTAGRNDYASYAIRSARRASTIRNVT